MSTLSQFFSISSDIVDGNFTNMFFSADVPSPIAGIASTTITYNPLKESESNFLDLTPFSSNYSFPTSDCCPRKYNFEGGWLICAASNVAWIVAPSSAEVSRTWSSRNDANTVAQTCTGCTGWFVPTCTQLLNPGYCCRKYWDSYSSSRYWSSTQANIFTDPVSVSFVTGSTSSSCSGGTPWCVRSFRCVTY